MGDFASVYVTCPDEATAARIAREVVERRLAACANILPPIRSVYRWEGRVEEASEVAMLLKTRRGKVQELTEAVARMHPYEVPCVVAFELGSGHPPYFDWVASETA